MEDNEFKIIDGEAYVPVSVIKECIRGAFLADPAESVYFRNYRAVSRILSAIGDEGTGVVRVTEDPNSYAKESKASLCCNPKHACATGNVKEVTFIACNAPIVDFVPESIKECLKWKHIKCLQALTPCKAWNSAVKDFFIKQSAEEVQIIPEEYFKILVSKEFPNELLAKISNAQFHIMLTEGKLTLDHWKHLVDGDNSSSIITRFTENHHRLDFDLVPYLIQHGKLDIIKRLHTSQYTFTNEHLELCLSYLKADIYTFLHDKVKYPLVPNLELLKADPELVKTILAVVPKLEPSKKVEDEVYKMITEVRITKKD